MTVKAIHDAQRGPQAEGCSGGSCTCSLLPIPADILSSQLHQQLKLQSTKSPLLPAEQIPQLQRTGGGTALADPFTALPWQPHQWEDSIPSQGLPRVLSCYPEHCYVEMHSSTGAGDFPQATTAAWGRLAACAPAGDRCFLGLPFPAKAQPKI